MSKNVLVQFSSDIDLPPAVVIQPKSEQVVKIIIQSLLARRLAKIPDQLIDNGCTCKEGQ
jgi:hypothetical protein